MAQPPLEKIGPYAYGCCDVCLFGIQGGTKCKPVGKHVRLYYRSATVGRCCIRAADDLFSLSQIGGSTALSCVEWRHGRHFETVTSNQKSDDAYLREEHLCQISSRADLKRRDLIGFLRRLPFSSSVLQFSTQQWAWPALYRCPNNNNNNKNNMSSDRRSALDLKTFYHHFVIVIYWPIIKIL